MAETTINDGGYAFPHDFEDSQGHHRWKQSQGMPLRDWFAGQALTNFAGLIDVSHAPETAKAIAELSYTMADAMLKHREASDAKR